LLYLKGKVHS